MSILEKWDSIIRNLKVTLNTTPNNYQPEVRTHGEFEGIYVKDVSEGGKISHFTCNHSFYVECPKGGCTVIDKDLYDYIACRLPLQSFKCDYGASHRGPVNQLGHGNSIDHYELTINGQKSNTNTDEIG